MKKLKSKPAIVLYVLIILIGFFLAFYFISNLQKDETNTVFAELDSGKIKESGESNGNGKQEPTIYESIPKLEIETDKDKDGISDADDILEGARIELKNKPRYVSKYYYKQAYPPDNEGVCTDTIWRALKNAGYIIKDMVDADIKKNTSDYPGLVGGPDPDIDFRRVSNLHVYFKKYAISLTTELKPYDIENLKQWQRGDIITFREEDHIAIISDKRRPDGVPYIIHNPEPTTMEVDELEKLMPRIWGHFRFSK